MYPEAKALRDSGFQSARVAGNILRAYLRFRLGDTSQLGAYAHTLMDLDPDPTKPAEIVVTISPDSIWPLILPTYSKSERFVLATALATILLHELAVRYPRVLVTTNLIRLTQQSTALRKGCHRYHDGNQGLGDKHSPEHGEARRRRARPTRAHPAFRPAEAIAAPAWHEDGILEQQGTLGHLSGILVSAPNGSLFLPQS